MTVAIVTGLYGGLLGLVHLMLSGLVVRGRFRHRVSLGDGGHPGLARLIRVHANFAEYVPLALVLLLIVELEGWRVAWVHGLGAVLVLARVLHAAGLAVTGRPNPAQAAGSVLTFGMLGVTAVLAAIGGIGPTSIDPA